MEVDDLEYAGVGVGAGGVVDKSKSSPLATNHNHHNKPTATNLKKIFFPNYSPVINRPLKFHFKFSGCRPTAERNRNSSMSTNMNSNYARSGGVGGGIGGSSSTSSNNNGGGNHHHQHHNIFHNNFNNNTSCNINHYGSNINNNNNINSNCNNVNDNFKRKIVVARGRLLKPLSDRKKFVNLSNFCFVQI